MGCDQGRPITAPLPFPGTVHSVRFSPDGRLLLSIGNGPYVRVSDATGGEAIALVPRTEKWVEAALTDIDSTVPWALTTDPRPVAHLTTIAEWLSGHHINQAGGSSRWTRKRLQEVGGRMRSGR